MEERKLESGAEVVTDSLPGGQALAAPHEEVVKEDEVVGKVAVGDQCQQGKICVKSIIRQRLKVCSEMESQFPSKDYEGSLYLKFCENFE